MEVNEQREPLWNAPRGMEWVREIRESVYHLAADFRVLGKVLCGDTVTPNLTASQCGGVSGDPCRRCQAVLWKQWARAYLPV